MRLTIRAGAAVVTALAVATSASGTAGPAVKPTPAAAAGQAITVLDRPVQVTAHPRPGDSGGHFEAFDIVVAHGARHCKLTTLLYRDRSPSQATAIEDLRRSIGWRDGYLFVRTQCGPGNGWKCTSEAVFQLRNGRLVGLGTLAARTEAAELATSWRDGMFWDEDADLEINALTSHVAAPRFEIRLRERNGRLVADADSTWAANAIDYAWREGVARENSKPPGKRGTWEDAVAPRLGNAALAKYCGRAGQLAAILAEARALFPPGLFTRFEAELAKIQPGALPHTSAPPEVVDGKR